MSMYEVKPTTQFRKDYKLMLKQKRDIGKLEHVVRLLANGEALPQENRDHALSGNWKNHRECHIAPDWLLIYKIEKNVLVLTLTRTGSHSELFDE